MLLKEDILNELREISPMLADMPYTNVYTVDQDYFSDIEAEFLARIAADKLTADRSFEVPAGYFDGLAGNIMSKIKAAGNESEDGGFSALLAGIGNKNIYSVPQGYFESVTGQIISKTGITVNTFAEELKTLSPVLVRIGNENIFSAPQGYFESVTGEIINKINISADESVAAELKILSPVLAGIGNRNIYTAPQGYFEGLVFTEEKKEPARVIKMNSARSVFKYAAAAVITGLLGLSIINITGPGKQQTKPVENPVTAMVTANEILKNGTFDQDMNNLSDQDIDQFLQESGQDVKTALVVSSANDESKLPQAEDYILDENTLDNYLKQNNLKN